MKCCPISCIDNTCIYVSLWYMYHGAYFGVSNNSVNSNVTLSSWQLLCLFISHINKIRSLYAYCVVLKYIFFNWCKISNDMKVYTDETMYIKSFQNVQLHVLAGMLVPYWQGKTG